MQLLTLVISTSCLVLSGEAAASSVVSLLLKSQGPGKVDTKTLVASLGEVAKGLQTEDKKATAVALSSKSTCKKTDMNLRMALSKGKRTLDMATDDYQKTSAQVNALEASLGELKGQIASSNRQLDSLQAKLKKMRKDKGLLKKKASAVLRQVEGVIAKTYLRESSQQRKGPSAIERKASTLEQLSESLSFLQEASDDGVFDNEEQHAVVDEKVTQKKGPVLILKADKQAVVRASDATQRGFNEEEKKIIDLVDVERKKLQDLEDNLQDLQPAISNKLKQAMEINRTLDAAGRGMQRDSELMTAEAKKCALVAQHLKAQKNKRRKVVNDVSMASKVLEHMDTKLFLSLDLVGLKRASPSFLQIADQNVHEEPVDDEEDFSFLQEEEEQGTEVEEMVETYGSSEGMSQGPFDGVTKMIGGLIASLKAQANGEVNQHQFCQDSLGKNRRDRIAKKNSIDTLSSTIRWSKMAIVRLDDDLKYVNGEIKRLAAAQVTEKTGLKTETARVGKEFAEHKLSDEVITKVVVILTQLCDLKGAAASLSQESTGFAALVQKHSSKVGSRFSQCKEASNLLKSASKNCKELDGITKTYLQAFKRLSASISGAAKSTENARNTEKKSTNSARAQRASELATAQKDIKVAGKELKLIDDSKKQLENSCSHVETREEKMARRKEEIDALKEALNVLNGEAIPA